METQTTPQKTVSRLPHQSGVYLYYGQNGDLLYIGKAKDLKKRVSQYFQREDALSPKTRLLVSQIAKIETIPTASEFDAILLEARLIHDRNPKYNVVLKDDKSPLYILLTFSETLPHVITVRKTDLPKKIKKQDAIFGPFQSAGVVTSILRRVRHSIPFCMQKQRTGRACFYTHLGLCDPCPSYIDRLTDDAEKKRLIAQYRKNIFRLKAILSGKSPAVLQELEKEMKSLATTNRFEEASVVRNHVQNLRGMLAKRYDPMLYVSSDSAVEDIYANELSELRQYLLPYIGSIQELKRIECIDISNTGGGYATGSLVVLTGGKKDTSQYKKFRIRRNPPTGGVPNDVAMIAEVVTRRFSHPEWPKPDLFIVDGGKGQVSAALKVLPVSVPVVGLAKREEEIIIPLSTRTGVGETWKILHIPFTSPALHVMQRVRDEAHRVAVTYHRVLRTKSLFATIKAA